MTVNNISYKLLTFTAVVLLICSFLVFKQFIIIHIHSWYFFISQTRLLWAIASLLLCLRAFYKMSDSLLLSPVLTGIHTSITLLAIVVLSTIPLWGNALYLFTSGRYFEYSGWEGYHRFDNLHGVGKIILFIVLLAQLPVAVNVLGGLIKYGYLSQNKMQVFIPGINKSSSLKRDAKNNYKQHQPYKRRLQLTENKKSTYSENGVH